MLKIDIGHKALKIFVPNNVSRLGIKLSGGVDSSLVTFLLHLYKKEYRPDLELYPVTHVKISRPYQLKCSTDVLEFSKKITGVSISAHEVVYANPSFNEVEYQKSLLKLIKEKYNIQGHASGINLNPPKQISMHFDNICSGVATRELDRDAEDADKEEFIITDEYFVLRPLANFNKQDIAEVFKKLDLLDTLFPLTKSCEKKTMAVDDPHCKTCWWCLERQWGFNRFI
jgi:hypothetical protein